MVASGTKRAWHRPPRSRTRKSWEDPRSSDEEQADSEERQEKQDATLEQQHASWGDKVDESDGDEDLRGSDSDGDDATRLDAELPALIRASEALLPRADPAASRGSKWAVGDADADCDWDPLAGLGPRKKRKSAPLPVRTPGAVGGLKENTTVCLLGLVKTPQLNGQIGLTAGPMDGATGRAPVLLRDGSVKSLRQENIREVLTGSIVQLRGLQNAKELNGQLAECGDFHVAVGRYDVVLADGEPPKRLKEENVQLVRRFVQPHQLLSNQRRAFEWDVALARSQERERRPWSEQLALLKELKLPAPRLIPSAALIEFVERCRKGSLTARRWLADKAVLAGKAPTDSCGLLACRLLAVSFQRDMCSPSGAPEDAELCCLGRACSGLASLCSGPLYFLLPTLCVKSLPSLRAAATCAWPLYLQLCQALLCIGSEFRHAKTWCRIDEIFVGGVLSKPVYLLPHESDIHAPTTKATAANQRTGEGWLLSDEAESVFVGPPADGQVVREERALAELLSSKLFPGGWRSGTKLTRYRL